MKVVMLSHWHFSAIDSSSL